MVPFLRKGAWEEFLKTWEDIITLPENISQKILMFLFLSEFDQRYLSRSDDMMMKIELAQERKAYIYYTPPPLSREEVCKKMEMIHPGRFSLNPTFAIEQPLDDADHPMYKVENVPCRCPSCRKPYCPIYRHMDCDVSSIYFLDGFPLVFWKQCGAMGLKIYSQTLITDFYYMSHAMAWRRKHVTEFKKTIAEQSSWAEVAGIHLPRV